MIDHHGYAVVNDIGAVLYQLNYQAIDLGAGHTLRVRNTS